MHSNSSPLTSKPIPPLSSKQVELFTLESLRARKIQDFNPKAVLDILQSQDNLKTYGIDIGGDKITSSIFEKDINNLKPIGNPEIMQSNKGEGYLNYLKRIALKSRDENIPVGISLAATVLKNKLVEGGSNLEILINELKAEFDSDFAKIFHKVLVVNDAVAGLISGVMQSQEKFPDTKDAIFLINGSGLNAAVLKNNEIWAGEMGHIKLSQDLNSVGQNKICNLYKQSFSTHLQLADNSDFVCIENVASSKAGVEDLWFQKTNQKLNGKEISEKMQSGDNLAIELYNNSAIVTANMVKGLAKAFDVLSDNSTAIICHGGTFNVPGYPERLIQILEQYLGFTPNIIFTKDYSPNACLDGAAVAALTLK